MYLTQSTAIKETCCSTLYTLYWHQVNQVIYNVCLCVCCIREMCYFVIQMTIPWFLITITTLLTCGCALILITEHSGETAKTSGLEIRIMCLREASCLKYMLEKTKEEIKNGQSKDTSHKYNMKKWLYTMYKLCLEFTEEKKNMTGKIIFRNPFLFFVWPHCVVWPSIYGLWWYLQTLLRNMILYNSSY